MGCSNQKLASLVIPEVGGLNSLVRIMKEPHTVQEVFNSGGELVVPYHLLMHDMNTGGTLTGVRAYVSIFKATGIQPPFRRIF